MKIALYQGARDNRPEVVDLTWSELAALLVAHRAGPCTVADCPGKKCPHKMGRAWSPVDIEGTRADANVRAVTAAALDLDILGPMPWPWLDSLLAAGVSAVLSSSHNHREEAPRLRLVLELSRPVTRAEWPRLWRAVIARFGLPADPACGDPSRIYFAPSAPQGAPTVSEVIPGTPLDVDALLGQHSASDDVGALAPNIPNSRIENDSFPHASSTVMAKVLERLAELGPAKEGDGGDAKTYRAASIAVHDYALSPDEALEVLTIWNRGNLPPWSIGELRSKVDNAERYATGEYGAARASIEAFAWAQGAPIEGGAGSDTAPLPEPARALKASSLVAEIMAIGTAPRIKTPFPKLNAALGGGFLQKTLTVLTAGTGKGKTSFALELALAHAVKAPVIFYVGEMTPPLVASRLIAQRCRVSWGHVVEGRLSENELVSALEGLDLRFVPRCADAVGAVRREIEAALEEFPDTTPLVIIDYIQLLAEIGKDMRISTMQAVVDLRQMAESLPVVTLAISQSSRGGSARIREGGGAAEDYVDTGAETSAIEQASANTLVLSFKSAEDADEHEVTLMVAKARLRGPGKVGFKFHGPTGRWSELDAVPLSKAESEREAEIMKHLLAHQAKACGGEPGTYCGKAQMTTKSLTTAGPHKVVGNVQSVTVTLQRMEGAGRIKKIGGGYVTAGKGEE
jgi:hypothetical protein